MSAGRSGGLSLGSRDFAPVLQVVDHPPLHCVRAAAAHQPDERQRCPGGLLSGGQVRPVRLSGPDGQGPLASDRGSARRIRRRSHRRDLRNAPPSGHPGEPPRRADRSRPSPSCRISRNEPLGTSFQPSFPIRPQPSFLIRPHCVDRQAPQGAVRLVRWAETHPTPELFQMMTPPPRPHRLDGITRTRIERLIEYGRGRSRTPPVLLCRSPTLRRSLQAGARGP